MAKTLKEQYENKRVRRLKERLGQIDRKVMVEMKLEARDRLILEAFDKQQMAAAIDIVKKLKAINFGKLQVLAQARDAAVEDVTRTLGGNKSQGLVRKIIDLFKGSKENPLVDALAFSEALKNFFDQFTQYATELGTTSGSTNIKVPLSQIITGKDNVDLAVAGAIKGLDDASLKKLKDLQNVITTGFKPEGALAKIGRNWIDKYLKGRKGLQELARQIVGMSLQDLNVMAKSVSGSLQNVDAVGEAAAGASEQGAIGTTGTTGADAAGAAAPGTGSTGTKSPATAPGAQVAGGNVDAEKVKKARSKIVPLLSTLKQNPKEINTVVQKLMDAGFDPDKLT